MFARLLGVSAAALALASPCPAALIVNGSFEQGTLVNSGSFDTLPAGSTNIHGWTVGGASIDYIQKYWQPSSGSRSIDLSGTGYFICGDAGGALSQVVATTAGQSYRVLFDLAGNTDGGPTTKSVVVAAGATSQTYTFDTGGRSRTDMGWVTKEFVFTATGTSTTLSFTSGTGTQFGPALDNVRADAIGPAPAPPATPEPASLAVFGALGLAGAFGYRRRRGRAATA